MASTEQQRWSETKIKYIFEHQFRENLCSRLFIVTILTLACASGLQLSCILKPDQWLLKTRTLQTCQIGNQAVHVPDVYLKPYPAGAAVALSINYNRNVEYLPLNMAATFPNLYMFQVHTCSVKRIEGHFKGLRELYGIHVIDNKLEYIANDAFIDNTKLYQIHLHINRLKHLGSELFKPLYGLKKLYLQSNLIATIEPDTLDGLTGLIDLNLEDNVCINKRYSSDNLSLLKADLEKKCTIVEKPQEPSKDDIIKNLKTQIESLKSEIQNLKRASVKKTRKGSGNYWML